MATLPSSESEDIETAVGNLHVTDSHATTTTTSADDEAASEPMSEGAKPRELIQELPSDSDVDDTLILDELHRAQISYILEVPMRLLGAENSNIWSKFIDEQGDKYTKHTAVALSKEFNERILPHVLDFNLSETDLHMFGLLKLHPEYKELPGKGYMRLPKNERVANRQQPRPGVDCRIIPEQYADSSLFERIAKEQSSSKRRRLSETADFEMSTGEADPASHTLVLPRPYLRNTFGKSFEPSQENAALLSAMLSNDWELSNCGLLDPEEIHKRLRSAKREFEQKGLMPVNCIAPKELIEKLQKLKKLKKTMADVMAKYFMCE